MLRKLAEVVERLLRAQTEQAETKAQTSSPMVGHQNLLQMKAWVRLAPGARLGFALLQDGRKAGRSDPTAGPGNGEKQGQKGG